MTRYTTHRHKRPGSESSESARQLATDGGTSDSVDQSTSNSDQSGADPNSESDEQTADPSPRADGDPDDDPDPPATADHEPSDEADNPTPVDDPSEAWKETNYPRKPTWAPDCPSCGGPVINVTIAGPGVSQVSPCGCNVAPSDLEIL
ncbi:hypothetical protein [Halovivax ruber]|nr:hypothetical protein [Halovivax ruber]